MSNKTVTEDQVKNTAELSKIRLNIDELEKYTKDFNDILGYISKLDEVNTDGIEEEHHLKDYVGTVLEEDDIKESMVSREELMQNAGSREKLGYIVTSKIVEKD